MNTIARSALLIVDVQKDFCRGGTLEVQDGDLIVPTLNRLIASCSRLGHSIYASRDWHPADSMHFLQHGGIWPTHCVAGTQGAEFHRDLELPAETVIISKGQSRSSDGYSAFDGCTLLGELFQNELAGRAIRTLYVTGLATDYCVRHSVLDALRTGLRVNVVTDAIAGVDRRHGDAQRALKEMHDSGAELTTTTKLEKTISEINSQ
jgi:nicotinamidase/pyrazinamidase